MTRDFKLEETEVGTVMTALILGIVTEAKKGNREGVATYRRVYNKFAEQSGFSAGLPRLVEEGELRHDAH